MSAARPSTPLAHAVRLLARGARSERSLRESLLRRFADQAEVEKALDKLRSMRYLDDPALAATLAERAFSGRSAGPARVLAEMEARGIAEGDAGRAVSGYLAAAPVAGLMEDAIARRVRACGAPADIQARDRLCQWLVRRGFDPEEAEAATLRFEVERNDESE